MRIRRVIAASRVAGVAGVAALPYRMRSVVRHDARVLAASARWIVQSREHTNFTYDLAELNLTYLAWYVAAVTGVPVGEARSYLAELHADVDLRHHISARTYESRFGRLADLRVRYGRRAGWYAIARALKPRHIVETGTDKGLGSCVLAAALLRNGSGVLTTIDTDPEAGYLIAGEYSQAVDRRTGDSVRMLAGLGAVDLFIHDSDHRPAHERAELAEVTLAAYGVPISDNSHVTDVLQSWAEANGLRFLYFQEQPLDHWYRTAGPSPPDRPT